MWLWTTLYRVVQSDHCVNAPKSAPGRAGAPRSTHSQEISGWPQRQGASATRTWVRKTQSMAAGAPASPRSWWSARQGAMESARPGVVCQCCVSPRKQRGSSSVITSGVHLQRAMLVWFLQVRRGLLRLGLRFDSGCGRWNSSGLGEEHHRPNNGFQATSHVLPGGCACSVPHQSVVQRTHSGLFEQEPLPSGRHAGCAVLLVHAHYLSSRAFDEVHVQLVEGCAAVLEQVRRSSSAWYLQHVHRSPWGWLACAGSSARKPLYGGLCCCRSIASGHPAAIVSQIWDYGAWSSWFRIPVAAPSPFRPPELAANSPTRAWIGLFVNTELDGVAVGDTGHCRVCFQPGHAPLCRPNVA